MPQLPILPGMPGISGMRRPVAADAVRESELMRILGGTPPVVSPEEPEALKPWQLIGMALADAGATYGAGLNRNLLPGFQLRELQSRREQRAKEKTARKDRDAQQKFEAGLRTAALEYEDIQEQQLYERDKIDKEAARIQGLADEEKILEIKHGYNVELAGMRGTPGGDKEAVRIEGIVLDARRLIAQWALSGEVTADQIESKRKQLAINLRAEGISGFAADHVLSFFESEIVKPLKQQSDLEYAATADAAVSGYESQDQSLKQSEGNIDYLRELTKKSRLHPGLAEVLSYGGKE